MRSTLLLSIAALFVAASPAFAGGGAKGDVELGAYGGYGILDDYGTSHPKNGPFYGVRIGYFFTPNWSVEGSGQRLTTKTQFDSVGVTERDIHLDSFRGNLLYNFMAGQMVRPFLTAGAGYQRFEIVDSGGKASQMEWNAGAGIRWFPTPQWNVRLEGRYAGTKVDELDQMEKNFEAALGLSVLFGGGRRTEAAEEVHEAPPPANRPPTVTLACERSEAVVGESMSVTANASDPDGDALTYDWSATSGHVTGSGPTGTLDLTGATPPGPVTVTVHVSDGHDHRVSADCAVSIHEAPKPQAQAVSCLAGGFPRNLSRLTNVDKACLDDVAQRLQADPRASVTVIGYADAKETSPDKIGRLRATAVKSYLVQERTVDAARITVRSAGSTKPLDTGTDAAAMGRNRRVEVWFVPEGATIPE